MNVYTQAISEQKRIANSTVVDLLFGRGTFALSTNGNQQALSAARLAFDANLIYGSQTAPVSGADP